MSQRPFSTTGMCAGRARRCLAAAAIGTLCCWSADGVHAQPNPGAAAQRQAAELVRAIEIFERTVAVAERFCLSSTTRSVRGGFTLDLQSLVNTVKSSVGIEQQTEELRGASQQFAGAIAKLENDEIRKCMNAFSAPIFGLVIAPFEKPDAGGAWPDPIDFRFNFARAGSQDANSFSDNLRINLLRTSRSPISRRITNQFDPTGAPYFQLDISYPRDNEVIKGTIVAEVKADARLSAAPPVVTAICLQRPSAFPKVNAEYDLFDCSEGQSCRPSQMGTGWLTICGTNSGRLWPPPLSPLLRYASLQIAQDARTERQPLRWFAPSLEALTERNVEGVGYTVFTIRTEAFRRPDVIGVEFDIHVNGTRVDEDGLPPELRPLGNDARRPFLHSFALQSLNFQGAQGGCDRIELALTPVFADGRKGERRIAMLSYAALRDVEERREKFGESILVWRASYITPAREWRNIPIVHSYIYPVADAERRAAAAARAEADKRWVDEQKFSHEGRQVVGVVRPPRTIQANGTAAFGLGIGLTQPTGQIRFTFSDADARRLSSFMISQRGRRGGAQVIAPEPYVFQAVGGSRTVPGVCGTR